MDVASLLLLLSLAALGWFWFDSLSALEAARAAGKRVCDKANVQFLDDTVAGVGLALARDKHGRRVLRRTYRFAFSETGNSRLEGRLVVLGRMVESVTLEPYQILHEADTSPEPARTPDPTDDRNIIYISGGYGGCCGGCGSRDEIGGTECERTSADNGVSNKH